MTMGAVPVKAALDIEAIRREVEADPEKWHVTGWLSKGLGNERMRQLKAEIEARENERRGGETEMGGSWTEERRKKFAETMARKRGANEASGAGGGAGPDPGPAEASGILLMCPHCRGEMEYFERGGVKYILAGRKA